MKAKKKVNEINFSHQKIEWNKLSPSFILIAPTSKPMQLQMN